MKIYNFFIDGLQLPVAPSQMSTQINNSNETITLMNEGEVNILKKPGLTDIEFEVLLPNVRYPFAVYPNGFKPAAHYLNKLEQLKVNQKSFQFIVNRMMPNGKLLFDTNMTVSLEDYEIEEDAEEGFDIRVTINLKQFKSFGTKKVKVKPNTKKATVKKTRSTSGKKKYRTHKVVRGDTLWAIAKRYLGSGTRYPEIAKLNKIKNPNLIYPGQVFKIP
ncbi:LysM peptidoglycan-binding domain-containing protein [Paucisalibacillus globulus]|uniref:LysM peptidoglycan-binding domain-containing protein n=1 Tax=Paucisalibacillus globulus TaxID=351095 RepID=UPI000BB69D37|nr:LysM domain-containing protein [Paucisalibacillus globulus]